MDEGPDSKLTAEEVERYRKVFEHSNDAIFVVDLEADVFIDVNPAACDLLNYSREELLDLSPGAIHPDDMERVREEFLSQVVEEGSGFTEDLMCMTKDGREVPTEASGAALEPASGLDDLQMIAILHDISDRVRRRQELEAQVKRFEQFTSIVSHDIRNPLNVILSQAELAERTGESESFERIYQAVDRTERILDDLLRLAQVGTVIGEQEPQEFERLCRAAWDGVNTPGATLSVESSAVINADEGRTQDLLANLFRNAVEHGSEPTAGRGHQDASEQGSATDGPATSDSDTNLSVQVRVGVLDEENGFYVADDGPGIPPAERDAVFEWGNTTDQDGTGFGLAIVEQVATAHGWSVEITDSVAGGARFEITDVMMS